ncbi:MAG: bacillithiol biosynthesis BshC, partial [Gemmatimonadaceae bacterium]
LSTRASEIRAAGFQPQVADVEELSLVFDSEAGLRTRIARSSAATVASSGRVGSLSANVLLRPVLERFLLPTIAYAAGPGEFAYFAQVSAVANALDAELPLAVPRWSVTLVEPHIDRLLAQYHLTVEDVAHGDALAKRLLQQAVPPRLAEHVAAMRSALQTEAHGLRSAVIAANDFVPERTVDAIERAVLWRLDRFERRLRAAVRKRDRVLATDLGSLGGALYPEGVRQERMLNVVPFLVRYGLSVLEQMLDHARAHARGLVQPST